MGIRKRPDDNRLREIVTNSLSHQQQRERGYREQALKMFPNICGWCGREFSGARIKELTVHHKDFDHDNNPSDGSNWELLCIYCHEQMHASKSPVDSQQGTRQTSSTTQTPFANLKELLSFEEEKPPSD